LLQLTLDRRPRQYIKFVVLLRQYINHDFLLGTDALNEITSTHDFNPEIMVN